MLFVTGQGGSGGQGGQGGKIGTFYFLNQKLKNSKCNYGQGGKE
jgi:hypothetical protein